MSMGIVDTAAGLAGAEGVANAGGKKGKAACKGGVGGTAGTSGTAVGMVGEAGEGCDFSGFGWSSVFELSLEGESLASVGNVLGVKWPSVKIVEGFSNSVQEKHTEGKKNGGEQLG
jgi:hypothetical protein